MKITESQTPNEEYVLKSFSKVSEPDLELKKYTKDEKILIRYASQMRVQN